MPEGSGPNLTPAHAVANEPMTAPMLRLSRNSRALNIRVE